MTDFSELTLVFMTRNRTQFLMRNIKHWQGTLVSIIILDGSEIALSNDLVNSFGANVAYLHLPVSIEARLYKASNLIQTKYTLLAGDDDLFVQNGVSECISELERDSDLVSCMGTSIGFHEYGRDIFCFESNPNLFSKGQINDDNPLDRVRLHLRDYECTTIYAVIRTQIWKKNISLFSLSTSLPGNLMEIFYELATVYQGKTKVIKNVMWLRSHENDSQWYQSEPLTDWFLKIRNVERQQIFLNIQEFLLTDLSKIESFCRLQQIRSVLLKFELQQLTSFFRMNKQFYLIFLPLAFYHANRKFVFRKLSNILLNFGSRKKKKIHHHVDISASSNRIRRERAWESSRVPFMEFVVNLQKQNFVVDLSEMQRIHLLLRDFHEGVKG
jgi:glycosyltransferase domain-containing protein